jgi:hypothetical protein
MAVERSDRLTGVVASVNPKGVRLQGGLEWRNFSKFAKDITPPMRRPRQHPLHRLAVHLAESYAEGC